jgi:hypothetical protein
MAEESAMALDETLNAYLQDPNGSLDLSGLDFRNGGATKVAAFLSEW